MLRVFPRQNISHVVRHQHWMARLAVKADHPLFDSNMLSNVYRKHGPNQTKPVMPPGSLKLVHWNLDRLADRELRSFRSRNANAERDISRKCAFAPEPQSDLFLVSTEINHRFGD